MSETITAHAYEWEIYGADETGKDNDSIYAWVLDRDSNPGLVRFETYPNFFQLELPPFVNGGDYKWDAASATKFVNEATRWWRSKPLQVIYRPVKKTYYWCNGQLTPMCLVSFASRRDMMFAKKIFTGGGERGCFTTETFGDHKCDVWEADVHMVRKLLTMRNVPFSKWFNVRCDPVPEDEKISTLPNEWIAYWDHLSAVPDEICSSWSTNPRLLAIDIECYSTNHRRMPCKTSVEDVAYMISLIYQRLNHPETRKRYAIVFGDCNYIPPERLANTEVIVIPVSTKDGERIMIVNEFARLIRELDPEIITGYNILAFDYPYLDCRLNGSDNQWPQMGRLKGILPKMTSKNWKSGAYGHNSINILKMEGRISIDLLPIVRRDYKLPKYDLGTVSTNFLGRTKHDMSAQEMFKRYRENREARWGINTAVEEALIELTVDPSNFYKHQEFDESSVNFDDKPMSDEIRNCKLTEPYPKPLVSQALIDAYNNGGTSVIRRQQVVEQLNNAFDTFSQRGEELRSMLEQVQQDITRYLARNEKVQCNKKLAVKLETAIQRYEKSKEDLTEVVLYCIQDSELCIDLFHKLVVWIGLIEMSNIVGVTIMEIFTQGQQIRCFSQLYDLAARSGYVLDSRDMPVGHFAGGFVQEPVPGLYDNVVCLDFSSLYPSIMRAYNICYTTLVRPDWHNAVPDSMTETIVCEQEEPLMPTAARNVTEEDDPNDDPIDDDEEAENDLQEPSNAAKPAVTPKTRTVTYVNRFIKCKYINPSNGLEVDATGLLPKLVANLVNQRSAVRKVLAKEKDPITKSVLDKRQLALKVSANSFFGFLGVKNGGKMPLIEGAMSITAMGRKLIGQVNDYIKEKYNGKIIYNDTDSTMAVIPECKSSLECNYWGVRLSQEISGIKKTTFDEEGKPSHLDADGKVVEEDRPGLFLSPLGMEFEKAMRMLCLKKKKYAALLIKKNGKFKMLPQRNRNGDVIKDEAGNPIDSDKYEIMTKGIVLARRDNPMLLREIYQVILEMVMLRAPFSHVMNYLFDYVGRLLRKEFPHTHFLVIKGLGANYKSDTYFMKVFADEIQAEGKLVSPGDRLEFLIVKHPDDGDKKKKVLLGKKMKLAEQYTEDLGKWEIDINYYLEKILTNALDQLISIPYRETIEKLKFSYRPPRAQKVRTLMDPVKVIQEWLKNGGNLDDLKKNVMGHIKRVEEPEPIKSVARTQLNLPPVVQIPTAVVPVVVKPTTEMVWDPALGTVVEREIPVVNPTPPRKSRSTPVRKGASPKPTQSDPPLVMQTRTFKPLTLPMSGSVGITCKPSVSTPAFSTAPTAYVSRTTHLVLPGMKSPAITPQRPLSASGGGATPRLLSTSGGATTNIL